jgi:hypothetical protein
MDATVNVNPVLRYIKTASLSAAVRSLTFMGGNTYGITYTAGTTQMAKVPLFGVTSNQTLSVSLNNVKDMANDGTSLFAVEDRTGAVEATTNNIAKITTTGTVTQLVSNTVGMRSVVYDPVNVCLYVACPWELKIMKATGGGIGGDSSTFALTDFITGITNQPGRMALSKTSSSLYFTTEANSKQVGAVTLNAGTPGSPIYYDVMGGVGETSCFLYFDEIGAFLYAGPNATDGVMFSLNGFSLDATYMNAGTLFGQAVKLNDNSFMYPDSTTIKYVDLTSETIKGSNYISLTGDGDTGLCIVTGITCSASTAGQVAIKDGGSGGTIVAELRPLINTSEAIAFPEPLVMKVGPAYLDVTTFAGQVNVFGR